MFKTNAAATNPEEEKKEKINYEATVSVVRPIKKDGKVREDLMSFDMVVNGVTIQDCLYSFYKKEDGSEGENILFPSEEYTNSEGKKKRKNKAWFPVSKELRANIRNQIESLLG